MIKTELLRREEATGKYRVELYVDAGPRGLLHVLPLRKFYCVRTQEAGSADPTYKFASVDKADAENAFKWELSRLAAKWRRG